MEVRRLRSGNLNGELYHHGVKGQRWGVRRYQNYDGTYKTSSESSNTKHQYGTTHTTQVNNTVGYTINGRKKTTTGNSKGVNRRKKVDTGNTMASGKRKTGGNTHAAFAANELYEYEKKKKDKENFGGAQWQKEDENPTQPEASAVGDVDMTASIAAAEAYNNQLIASAKIEKAINTGITVATTIVKGLRMTPLSSSKKLASSLLSLVTNKK